MLLQVLGLSNNWPGSWTPLLKCILLQSTVHLCGAAVPTFAWLIQLFTLHVTGCLHTNRFFTDSSWHSTCQSSPQTNHTKTSWPSLGAKKAATPQNHKPRIKAISALEVKTPFHGCHRCQRTTISIQPTRHPLVLMLNEGITSTQLVNGFIDDMQLWS